MKPTDLLDARKRENKALELVMQDVMDGMEELALIEGYGNFGGCFEILSVEAPGSEATHCYPDLADAS